MKTITSTLLLFTLFSFTFVTPGRQLMPTSLRISVLDDAGNVEEGAKVTLYKTQQDYDKEENPVAPAQLTNNKGFVIFRSLENRIYYVTVTKGDKDNVGGSTQTGELKPNVLNKVNIIIE